MISVIHDGVGGIGRCPRYQRSLRDLERLKRSAVTTLDNAVIKPSAIIVLDRLIQRFERLAIDPLLIEGGATVV